MKFSAFNFSTAVAAGIAAAGYETPTPIQVQAIPPVMKGQDVMGLAQTGTGKTAAFVLPVLERLLQGGRGFVRALIVAPTRELAEQIHENIQTLGARSRLRSITIYGGVNIKGQIDKLRRGAEIIVACPGRLLDHLGQKTINLSRLEVLVLDEADHMFDMGFFPDIRRILKQLPAKRQTLLFSATMPDEIRRLAHEVLKSPVTVQVGISKPAETVRHAIYPVPSHLKTALLFELLKGKEMDKVLIFTRTKHRAKRIGEQLAKSGYQAASIQGNLSQNKRQAALNGFRDRTFQILVATDIAARGIDVSQISHVINYDIPATPDSYIHRIGRTGRAARTGEAFTLTTGEDAITVRAIERILGEPLKSCQVENFDYKVPAPKKNQEFARPPRQHTQRHPAARNRKDVVREKAGRSPQEPGSRPARPTRARTGRNTPIAGQKAIFGMNLRHSRAR
jgi:ATP-dependent RNA helicase RhlE